MMDKITNERLAELASIATAAHDIAPARPGTGWHWAGNTSIPGHIALSAWVPGYGRCSLMAFKRWGMGGAQPSFIGSDIIMRPAVEFVQYEVGDPSIVGRQNLDHSVYREDISGIAHPIAQHIAAFDPATAHALIAEVLDLRAQREAALKLHYKADDTPGREPVCPECEGRAGVHPCGCWSSEDSVAVCGHCREGWKGASVPYPCPTARALGVTGEDE